MSLEIRTSSQSGLVFLMSDATQRDIAVVYLDLGRVIFERRCGQSSATESHNVHVNDGKWHTVIILWD